MPALRAIHLSRLLGTIVVSLLALPAWSQQKTLTIDDLYDPVKKVFGTAGVSRASIDWLDDDEYLKASGESRTLVRVNARTGEETPLFDADRLEKALTAVDGITPSQAADAARSAARAGRASAAAFTSTHDALVVLAGDDLYYWQFGQERAQRLTTSAGHEEEVSFSPDDRSIAFVRDHDLFVVDLSGRERQLTDDGSAHLLNGKLDWVYQEEIYGRGGFRAYWWSPDSARLAFLQLNESPVPEFTVIDHIPYRLDVEETRYPKAGDPNPAVRLGVVRRDEGPVTWIDTSSYAGVDHLVVDVAWTPDGVSVAYQVQDREQTWLDLNLGSVDTGSTKVLLREKTDAWVSDHGAPAWLGDGSFLWFSERTGWKHLYHYDTTGRLLRAVTTGSWEVRTLHGIDEKDGWVYFSGTERSHIGSDVYRIRLDGTGLSRLSERDGTHTASFNPSFTYFLDTWSDVTTPPQVRLHRADGGEVRVIDAGELPALADYRLSAPEFVQVPNRNGFLMEAMIIKPPDFDAARRYPVFQHTYAGPHAPRVRNAWGGTTGLYLQLLAQQGIIVWVCDNQSASGKGAESAWVAYRRLGETELADIEDGLDWLGQHPWVDTSRIGIDGWSYGGFMTSYALTHSTRFVMGIAGGSVTDWRNYDSIYTERYMLTPQHNPDGYQRTAPRLAAEKLHGELFLVHGTMDDNVHMQNTLQFAYALEKAGKPFELMLYPKSRHGVTDPQLVKHMRERMLAFTLKTLKPERGAVGSTN
jgi:dipeptidyl-peptidase 4